MKSFIASGGLLAAAVFLPSVANAQATTAAGPAACEFHVWPTENYIGIKMGLLSGLGPIGAVADQAAHKQGVLTVKDLMREYLGPDVQLRQLDTLDYKTKLGLDARYVVTVHEPTPWYEDFKAHPELKEKAKAMNAKIKSGQRLTDSTNPCYAELVGTHIFYLKAMMYGSNLFSGWSFRKFDGAKVAIAGAGQVKNPLENFPPKDATMVPAAQAELRDAYAKDFVEWVGKKSGT